MDTLNYRDLSVEAFDTKTLLAHAAQLATRLCYSSDYPHGDMNLPSTIYDLPFLTEAAERNILGGNAKRLSNLAPVVSEAKVKHLAARNTGRPA